MRKTQVVYTGESASGDWLRHIAQQPGNCWIENRDGELVVVHEFDDLKEVHDEREEDMADVVQADCDRSDPAVDDLG